jgi:hypothetical protein
MDEMGVGRLRGLFQFQCVSARFRRFGLFTLLLGILVQCTCTALVRGRV